MRASYAALFLTAFFGTCPQVTVSTTEELDVLDEDVNASAIQGLYVVTDMYPFHLQARKVDTSLRMCNGPFSKL